MNNNDYSQQFMHALNSVPNQPTGAPHNNSKLTLIIVISVATIVVLIETIALIVLANKQTTSLSEGESTSEEYSEEEYPPVINENYKYDDEDNLIAFNETCHKSDGDYYIFTTENNYQHYDSSYSLTGSGTYTLIRDSIVALADTNSQKKTLYYGGTFIADGTIIYECDEQQTEEIDG